MPTPWGAIPIYSYGTALAASFLLGWASFVRADDTADANRRSRVFVAAMFAGLIAAYAGYFALHPPMLLRTPFPTFRDGHLDALSGVLGGTLSLVAIDRKHVASLFVGAAPALFFGFALTSVGAYAGGAHPGVPLPAGAPSWLVGIGNGLHPVQIYDSILAMLLIAIVSLAKQKVEVTVLAASALVLGHSSLDLLR